MKAQTRDNAPALRIADASLAESRKERLRECEKVLEEHAAAFVKVGVALREIRDGRLYEADGFDSWQAYMASTAKRFDVGKRRADQLIDAATICTDVVGTSGSHQWNERAVRQLRRLPTDVQRKKVAAAVERDAEETRKPITSTVVQKHVEKVLHVRDALLGVKKKKPEPERKVPDLAEMFLIWAGDIRSLTRQAESVTDNAVDLFVNEHGADCSWLASAVRKLNETAIVRRATEKAREFDELVGPALTRGGDDNADAEMVVRDENIRDNVAPIFDRLAEFYHANRDDAAALARMLAGVRDVIVPAKCQLEKLRTEEVTA